MLKRILLLAVLLLCAPAQAQESLPSLVVEADNNLGLALAHVVREYAQAKQVAVALSLSGAETGDAQSAEGSQADVFITASEGRLAAMKQQGLVDVYSETPITNDRLALVAPEGVHFDVNLTKRFPTGPLLTAAGVEPVFVLAYPGMLPEAEASREALKKLHAAADLEQYTVYLKDRKAMREAIRNQHAFGVFLASDAIAHGLNVLGMFPGSTHAPITYRAVVLAGNNMDEARKFVEFLKSDAAQVIFTRFGFGGGS